MLQNTKHGTIWAAMKKVNSNPAESIMVTQIKMDKTVNRSIDDFVHVAALSISYKMDLRKVCLYYNTWINLEEINSISCFLKRKKL